MAVITLGTATVGRATFQPGWKWSECVKPIAGTDSCEAAHLGYVVSGQMHVVMDDGTTADVRPGDLVNIAPGHDAWIVGDEPCVMIDLRCAKEPLMQSMTANDVPVAMKDENVEVRMAEVGDMTVSFIRLAAGTDLGPALVGLDGDLCPCPHWGYMLEGTLQLRTALGDHT